MKVSKFGGSSVASADKFKQVVHIVTSDKERKMVVVSAPGKRYAEDTKMTDLLIALSSKVQLGEDYVEEFGRVIDRYREIVTDLGMPEEIIADIIQNVQSLIDLHKDNPFRLLDCLKASGEDNNARLMAAYLTHLGFEAHYVNPKDAGIFVSDEPGKARVLPLSYEKLPQLRERSGILIIPGFFGYSEDGNMVTFSRGGSDITGSIIAAGVKADLYENFTDVDAIYSVDPRLVENPHEMKEVTYREMRELSYAGFSVFHDEALEPVFKSGIPVCVKNTNNPEAKGTFIVSERPIGDTPVVGIAGDKGFCNIHVDKYLLNREIGFGRRLLQILEDEGISYEHTPSGIDNISVIMREHQLTPEVEKRVFERIKTELQVDEISIERDLALVMVVGEGMTSAVGIAAKATEAFARSQINLEMINQGSSEVSMMFGVKASSLERAVQALYNTYFNNMYSISYSSIK
ncbi:aspartate kinase [Priestia megaterium]|nr:aspartate kinase [Priestia megaterium]